MRLAATVLLVALLVGGGASACTGYQRLTVSSPEGERCFDMCMGEGDESSRAACVTSCPSAEQHDGECDGRDHCLEQSHVRAGRVVLVMIAVIVVGLVLTIAASGPIGGAT